MYQTCTDTCGLHHIHGVHGEGRRRRVYQPFFTTKSSRNYNVLHRRLISFAASKKEEVQRKEEAEMSMPDSPPSKGSMGPVNQPSAGSTDSNSNSSSQPVEERLSAEEIASRMAELRTAAKEQENTQGLLEGVLEEAQLISWPSPKSAVLNTLLVIAIVAGTSVVLLGVNTFLAEVSRQIY